MAEPASSTIVTLERTHDLAGDRKRARATQRRALRPTCAR